MATSATTVPHPASGPATPSGAGADDLEHRLAVVVGQLNALHAELVDLVVEARDTNAWAGLGVRSLTHWLTWKAGVSNQRAAHLVRLAEARTTHPRLTAAFAAGRLTVDQAAVAVTVPPYADERVAEMAPLATVNQLRTIARCSHPATPAATSSGGDGSPQPDDTVTTWTGDDGRYHLRADLAADRGRIVDAALHAARNRLRDAAGGARIPWVDALVDVAERSLDSEAPSRRDRFRINVFLDPTATVPATWADGTTIPDAIRRHVTCDGLLSPVFTDGAHPVAVGRTQRIVPDRIRRLVLHRDRTCRVPWCDARRDLDVHHLTHWPDGGRTDYDALIALCRRCHRAHHHGALGISGDPLEPDGLVFTDHRGRIVTGQPRSVPPAGPPPDPAQPYEHALGERLDTRSVAAALPDPPQHAPPSAGAA